MKNVVTLLTAMAAITPSAAFATTIHVPGDQPTIQAGIDSAVNGDTVLVANGTYTGDGNRDIDFGGRAIVVMSEHGPEFTIIDCEGDSLEPHRGFFFHSGEDSTTLLEGFTIQGGFGPFDDPYGYSVGGGIKCDSSSSPTLKNNVISGNRAYGDGGRGGGIICVSSNPTIINNTISDNRADEYGGGIYCTSSDPVISGNIISRNSSVNSGGGVCCFFSDSAIISNNTISGNSTGVIGGGIVCFNSHFIISNNNISENSADVDGGGIACGFSNLTITGNSIIGNSADDEGGGVFCWDSDPTMTDNTISGNSAVSGGGLCCKNGSNPMLDNSIIAFSNLGGSVVCSDSSNPTLTCCDVYGNAGGDWVGCIADQADINGNFSLDPLFCDTSNADYHISSVSPCAPANNSCGVLIGALDVGCGIAKTIIDPDTMLYIYAFMIDPMTAAAYVGNFTDGHTASDIDPSSLLINSTISPTSWSILPSHPGFVGEVMEMTFPIRDFILGYGPLWDTSLQVYTVSGQFIDGRCGFSVDGEVTMINHTSGDINGDGRVNVADLTYLIDFLFRKGTEPPIPETADLDQNGTVNVADLTALVNLLFR